MGKLNSCVLAVGILIFDASSVAAGREASERSLAPYLYVADGEGAGEQLPLAAMAIEANVVGMIADVKIEQRFKNDGDVPIEAVYVFPASSRAAVYGMRMHIGERVVIAKIKERETARRDYEAAVAAGKTASLLEQERPNVFQMSVGNILPGEVIKVELRYSELVMPDERVYELVVPTVVGPRYEGGEQRSPWVANPYLERDRDDEAPYAFSFKASLTAPMPIQSISSPTHQLKIDYESVSHATINLATEDGGDRDVVLRYRLAGDKVQSGVLAYEDDESGYFLMMVEPPARSQSDDVLSREYTFIIDVSGSMHGFPLATAKALIEGLFKGVNDNDYFNLVLFSGASQVLSEKPLRATSKNLARAAEFLAKERGGGGTEVLAALQKALSLPKSKAKSRIFVMVTDGYVSVEKEAHKLIKDSLGNANFFAFGIGTSVNRHLIESLARAGQGEPFVVLGQGEASVIANRFKDYVSAPILTDVRFEALGVKTREVLPTKIPDLFAERPLVIHGKLPKGANGKLRLSGMTANGAFAQTLDLTTAKSGPELGAIRLLWARKMIESLSDEESFAASSATKEKITAIGLAYELMTPYTSFVAIDSAKRNNGAAPISVRQPLPMPQGVSSLALAGGVRAKRQNFLMAPSGFGKGGGLAERELHEDRSAEPPRSQLAPQTDDKLAQMAATPTKSRLVFNVLMAKGVSGPALQDAVQSLLPSLERCGQKGEITLQLRFDAKGKVIRITFAEGGGSRSERRCLERSLKTLSLGPSRAAERVAELVLDFDD